MSLLIILPNAINGLANLQEKMRDPSLLDAAVDAMSVVDVKMYIPKMKINTEIDLKDLLIKVRNWSFDFYASNPLQTDATDLYR